jgi:catecholate siderophore receptor
MRFALILTVASACFVNAAVAQTSDSVRTPVYILKPVEVVGSRSHGYAAVHSATATKTDTPIRDTPQSLSVITRDVIADQSMQNMADVVRYVPGVTMAAGEGHRDAPTIRGNSSTADFFVDGVRDDAQYFRDLYNVERVEALKGANALAFGRGGGGGIINRVIKQAQFTPFRLFTVEGGSFQRRRGTIDLTRPLSDELSLRVNAMYEDSRGFRDAAELHRRGINPTFTYAFSDRTSLRMAYEYFQDRRTVDRGIPSFQGRPAPSSITTFFGNPDSSYARTQVNSMNAVLEHHIAGLTIREHTAFADYQKFYQNSYAGSAVNSAGTQVSLAAYNHATPRRNAFSQTDFILHVGEKVQHTLLAGFEFARQRSDNFRQTGYYNGSAASYSVDVADPTVSVPIAFKQAAADADNRTLVNVAALYAQDQLAFSDHWQAIAGVRLDHFDVAYHNNRNGAELARSDALVSPRAGIIYKPVEQASLYLSYSVSHLPSSGDQFSSLNATTETLEPEQFSNYEIGGKWDVAPSLSLSASLYRLDRTNTSAPDPLDSKNIVQTGSQRSSGVEANAAGSIMHNWHAVASVALQRATIVSTTSAAKAGAKVPLVPARTVSIWNRYDIRPGIGAGVGVVRRSQMFAAIDNAVTLPGFTRLDGALFLAVSRTISAQLNVENLLDTRYYATSQGNNNIQPGSGRTVRVALSAR